MQSAELQLWHVPSIEHGVFRENRAVFVGAAVDLALLSAASASWHTLLMPMTKMTFFGPKVIAATRFPFPSIFTMTPSSLIALALERKKSAENVLL